MEYPPKSDFNNDLRHRLFYISSSFSFPPIYSSAKKRYNIGINKYRFNSPDFSCFPRFILHTKSPVFALNPPKPKCTKLFFGELSFHPQIYRRIPLLQWHRNSTSTRLSPKHCCQDPGEIPYQGSTKAIHPHLNCTRCSISIILRKECFMRKEDKSFAI